MEGEGACNDKHCRGMDVGKGQVADELSLDKGADVSKVSAEVVHIVDGCASCDGRLDLAEVLLGFTEEFFGFVVIGG